MLVEKCVLWFVFVGAKTIIGRLVAAILVLIERYVDFRGGMRKMLE